MRELSVIRKVNLILLMAAVLAMPFWLFIVPRILTFFAVSAIIVLIVERKRPVFSWSNTLLFLLSLLYLASLWWTSDPERGQFEIEVKLSLFIFPVFFSLLSFSKSEVKWILLSFIMGLLLAVPIDFYRAYQLFSETQNFESFFYDNLSRPVHPGYLSMYINFGLIVLLKDLLKPSLQLFNRKWIYLIAIALLSAFNIFLFAKIGIIAMFVILAIGLTYFVIKTKQWIKVSLIVLGLTLTGFIVVQSSAYVRNTIKEVVENMSYEEGQGGIKAQGSTSLRWVVWDSSISLIKEEPLKGYGLGGTQAALVRQYEIDEQPFALARKLNCHNQYLQTTLTVGVFGLLLLLASLFTAIYAGFRRNGLILVGFCLLVMTHFSVESVLKVQAGTMFFGLFFCLLVTFYLQKVPESENQQQ